MPAAGVTHDIVIQTTAGASVTGFMFDRGGNPNRPYEVVDFKSIPRRTMSDEELSQFSFPAEMEMVQYQNDWLKGIGGTDHYRHPRTLASGDHIDTSVAGVLRPSRALQTETLDQVVSDAIRSSGFARYGSEIWAFIGRDCYIYDFTNDTLDFGETPTASALIYKNGVSFNSVTYVPSWTEAGAPLNYLYKNSAGATTWNVIADHSSSAGVFDSPRYLAVANDLLWSGQLGGGANKHNISSTSDGTNVANWSSAISIGDSTVDMTGLIGDGDRLLIFKEDGVFTYTPSGRVINLTPQFEHLTHSFNFFGSYNWNGRILIPAVGGQLLELQGDIVRDISLRITMPEQTQLHGNVVAIHGDLTKVYLLIHESANTRYHILMGQLVDVDGTVDYRWHHIGRIAYTGSETVDHSSLFAATMRHSQGDMRRLWIGIVSSGEALLPRFITDDGDAEDKYDNSANCLATFTAWDGKLAKINKTFASATFDIRNLGSAGRKFTVSHRVDEGSWLTTMSDAAGNADGVIDSTSSTQMMTFPLGTTGKKLEMRVVPAADGLTATPSEMLGFTVTAQLRPTRVEIFPLRLRLSDNQHLLNGAIGGQPANDLAQLRTFQGQAAAVTIIDSEGTSHTCVFLPGEFKVRQVAHEFGRRPEYVVDCVLAEV